MVGRSSVRGHGVLQAPDNIIRCAYAVGGGASEKPFRLCVPSQNGFVADPPHRHRTTTSAGLPSLRGGGDSSWPSGVTTRAGPWTTSGPLGFGVMVTSLMAAIYAGTSRGRAGYCSARLHARPPPPLSAPPSLARRVRLCHRAGSVHQPDGQF